MKKRTVRRDSGSDYSSRRQGRKAARKERREREAAAFWLTLAAAGVGLCVGILGSDLFKVESVQVVCQETSIRQEALARAEGLQYGTVWLPPTGAIERTVGALPRVKSVDLDRDLPRALVIAVHPRQPVVALECDGRYMLVDEEGVCLTWTGKPPHYLPRARMTARQAPSVGRDLPGDQGAILQEVVRGLHEAGLSAGTKISLTNRQMMSVWTEEGVLGKLGDAQHLEEKVILFGKLLKALRAKGEKPLYIDMRVPSHPTYRRA